MARHDLVLDFQGKNVSFTEGSVEAGRLELLNIDYPLQVLSLFSKIDTLVIPGIETIDLGFQNYPEINCLQVKVHKMEIPKNFLKNVGQIVLDCEGQEFEVFEEIFKGFGRFEGHLELMCDRILVQNRA